MDTQLATITTAHAQDINFDFTAIETAANLQPKTKAQYTKQIEHMIANGINPADYLALQRYANGLKTSARAFLKSALRLSTLDFEKQIKANATGANIQNAQAAIMRLEAMRDVIEVKQTKGTKAHTWLSQKQVTDLMKKCPNDLTGKRDWIVLGLMLGAGLRRDELANLTFDAILSQPTKAGARYVLHVIGKGNKGRDIPISETLANRLQEWKEITGGGMIARAMVRKSKSNLAGSMSAVAIFQLVSKYGAKIGKPGLAPHDLRRTFAQLGYSAGVPITQISKLLGHANVSTTQKYLNLDLDLETTVSDFIPLAG